MPPFVSIEPDVEPFVFPHDPVQCTVSAAPFPPLTYGGNYRTLYGVKKEANALVLAGDVIEVPARDRVRTITLHRSTHSKIACDQFAACRVVIPVDVRP